MKKTHIALALAAALSFTACTEAVYTSGNTAQTNKGKSLTMGLDSQDFINTAETMVNSLLSSPAFANIPVGARKVIYLGKIKNDTTLRIDTDKISARITEAMLNSGKFIQSSELQAGGTNSTLQEAIEETRDNDEFNRDTVIKKGQAVGIDYELEGKISQTNVKLSNGKTQVEYFFNLRVNDAAARVTVWQKTEEIVKAGSSKSVTW